MKEENNWLLNEIKKSLNKNGTLQECDLKLLRVHSRYKKEFSNLISALEETQHVKAYLTILNEIRMVDETMKYVGRYACNHILVKNNDLESGDNHTCIRCGMDIDLSIPKKVNFNNYVLPLDSSYDEARVLYDEAVLNLGESVDVNEIISEMRKLHSYKKVYKK